MTIVPGRVYEARCGMIGRVFQSWDGGLYALLGNSTIGYVGSIHTQTVYYDANGRPTDSYLRKSGNFDIVAETSYGNRYAVSWVSWGDH